MTIDLFAFAARRKLRFQELGGSLSVEDVWDLPLKAVSANRQNSLDLLAQKLQEQVDRIPRRSFVDDEQTEASDPSYAKEKLEIVLAIIAVKKAERKAREGEAQRNAEASQLDALIARKQNQELENLSIEELQKRRAALTAAAQ